MQYEDIPLEDMESREVSDIMGSLPRTKHAGGAQAHQTTGNSLSKRHRCMVR